MTIPVPDPRIVRAAMETMEGLAHQAGWDGRPQLAMFGKPSDVELGEGLLVLPLPVPNEVWADTGASLLTFGMNLVYARHNPAIQQFVTMMADAGFVAIALCNEIWVSPSDFTDEQRAAYERGDIRTMADVPGRVEARQVLVIDLAGTCYWLMRRRDQEPDMVGTYKPGDDGFPSGRLIKALQLACIALKEALYPDAAAADAADPEHPHTKLRKAMSPDGNVGARTAR